MLFLMQIRTLVDPETHDLFQKKLRDRALRKEENFRWCSHVSIRRVISVGRMGNSRER